MTYWADNIKFIKDILDSKFKKIEDAIVELEEQESILSKEPEQKKAREHFIEAARTLELIDTNEMTSLAETMFKDMPDTERDKEIQRLDEIKSKYDKAITKINQLRSSLKIK
uniref:Uncharacterized protein n=1 Tax=Lepeophtheirus salmonis TaxID=72036 RepID=A0A0K2U2J1_LEPSM|nr:uncharacterized protein LOC121117315 [Lepeophtheirus salmonis]